MQSVLIIESPGAQDITSGDRQGAPVHELLKLLRIPSTYQPLHTGSLLERVLSDHLSGHDLVHICGHGSEKGIHFTDGTNLSWQNLGLLLIGLLGRRFAILSACGSANVNLDPSETLVKFLNTFFKTTAPVPRCVLTFLGSPFFPDAVLAWGLFYRRLDEELQEANSTLFECPPRAVYKALLSVKNSGLKVKICASFWHDRHGRYFDISPWKAGDKTVTGWEA